MQNAQSGIGAFCNTFDLQEANIDLENQFLAFWSVDVFTGFTVYLHRGAVWWSVVCYCGIPGHTRLLIQLSKVDACNSTLVLARVIFLVPSKLIDWPETKRMTPRATPTKMPMTPT